MLVEEIQRLDSSDLTSFSGSMIERVLSLLNELVFCFDNDFFPWTEFEPTVKRVLKALFEQPGEGWKEMWLRHSLFGAFYPLLLRMEADANDEGAIFQFLSLAGEDLAQPVAEIKRKVDAFSVAIINDEIPESELQLPEEEQDGENLENAQMLLEEKQQRKATRLDKAEEDSGRLKTALMTSWTDFFIFHELLLGEPLGTAQGGVTVRRASLWYV